MPRLNLSSAPSRTCRKRPPISHPALRYSLPSESILQKKRIISIYSTVAVSVPLIRACGDLLRGPGTSCCTDVQNHFASAFNPSLISCLPPASCIASLRASCPCFRGFSSRLWPPRSVRTQEGTFDRHRTAQATGAGRCTKLFSS